MLELRCPSSPCGSTTGHSTSLLGQLNLQRSDHAHRDVAGVVDAADVDDDNFEALVHRADFADRRFGTGEEEIAVQFVDPAALADVVEHGLFGRGASYSRRCFDDAVSGPDRRA